MRAAGKRHLPETVVFLLKYCQSFQRDPGLSELKTDPLIRSLHADMRWGAFLRKMGLSD